MPYSTVADVPDYVPAGKRKQWLHVFNSEWDKHHDKPKAEREKIAFAAANGVAGPNSKSIEDSMKKGTVDTQYEASASNAEHQCRHCIHFDPSAGNLCLDAEVARDPKVPVNASHQKTVSPSGWCNQFRKITEETRTNDDAGEKVKAARGTFAKFIPFAKVDAQKREVWGIVTAEVPDKEDEVCDYAGSKPYYQAVIDEMSKATGGKNFFPLREMHQLSAVGKCIGFEFRDDAREIFMGFKVVDDDAWKKVDEGVYTGFSQGGRKVSEKPDEVFKGCMRYIANPSENSLVDNPCLSVAHFAYVNKTGAVELRKVRSEPLVDTRVQELEEQVANLQLQLAKKAKTKRVAGEDLSSSAFAYVGDPERTETWKLPIKFSTPEKTKSHIRNALARFSATQGIPAGEKAKVHARIVNAARRHGIDTAAEKAKLAAIYDHLRKSVRTFVNRNYNLCKLNPSIMALDHDLGKLSNADLSKGMWEVGRMAEATQEVAYLLMAVTEEQFWEGDEDSELPELLAESAHSLIDCLLRMVAEESEELRQTIARHEGAIGEARSRAH